MSPSLSPIDISVTIHEAPLVHLVQQQGRLADMSPTELAAYITEMRALRSSHQTRKSVARGSQPSAARGQSSSIDISRFLGGSGKGMVLPATPTPL